MSAHDDLMTPAPLLAVRLRQQIRDCGPIRFSEFMRTALYDPGAGYYTSGRTIWGDAGDYLTAPAVHPAFGAGIARLAGELDEALGRPDRFALVEVGCGAGKLARAVLATLAAEQAELASRIELTLVERGEQALRSAVAACAEYVAAPVIAGELAELPAAAWQGLVFSNELLDAFPVERVRRQDGVLAQSWIEADASGLRETFRPPVDPALEDYLALAGVELDEGQVAEICLEVAPWFEELAARLARGALLSVDYGHETATLYGPERRQGTLVTMRAFELGDDPLATPGERDLTAHVDFGHLRRLGERHGFHGGELASLRVLLLGTGAAERMPEDVRERLALRHLLVGELGDAHRALWQTKGIPAGAVRWGRERLGDPGK